jgi:hypothetical protein
VESVNDNVVATMYTTRLKAHVQAQHQIQILAEFGLQEYFWEARRSDSSQTELRRGLTSRSANNQIRQQRAHCMGRTQAFSAQRRCHRVHGADNHRQRTGGEHVLEWCRVYSTLSHPLYPAARCPCNRDREPDPPTTTPAHWHCLSRISSVASLCPVAEGA